MRIFQKHGDSLVGRFEFDSFPAAMRFVQEVGVLAEECHHHPDIEVKYTSVTLRLTTHDANNTVTEKDKNLALEIERLFG